MTLSGKTAQNPRLNLSLIVLFGLQLALGLFLWDNRPVQAAPEFLRVTGQNLTLNGQPVILKGSNFYPLHHSFTNMWREWDGPLVREGLEQAAELGNNSVRILLPFKPDYGWTSPADGAVVPEYFDRLRQFLQIAQEFRIRAIVTLFDFEGFVAPNSPEEARHRRYAHDIITALRDDDRVLAWDLHNEPDNYGPWNSEDKAEPALVWLTRMRDYVRSLDPNHLITIGMGKRESFFRKSAQGLTPLDLSDFISLHNYNAPALADEIYSLQEASQRKKPIILEETGWPSGPIYSTDFSQKIQADLYRKTLEVAGSHNIAGVFQWMLFDAEPSGFPPWDDFNNHFGLVQGNGTLKPAAYVWRGNFKGTALPAASVLTNLPLTKQELGEPQKIFYPQTNHWLGSPHKEFWRRGGGANIFGYPLTDAFIEEDIGGGRHQPNDENKTPIYQWFEKGRFEYHRERRSLPDFQLLGGIEKYLFVIDRGNVGLELAGARGYRFPPAVFLPGADEKGYKWFDYYKHSLQEPFFSFWHNNLGGALFGSPISEPFEETNPETGQRRLVQYFEKARLEYRPEFAPTRAMIEVGNVGAELLKLKGWIGQAYQDGGRKTEDGNQKFTIYDLSFTIEEGQELGDGGPRSIKKLPTLNSQSSVLSPQYSALSTQHSALDFADPAFAALWQRTDGPVAAGTVSRTWLWGEKPFATNREPYAEAPGGTRLVQYFDKSRMELTNPAADRSGNNAKWYVTNGLLVREMIGGQLQLGNNIFEPLAPADIPLAGDPPAGNPSAPTYASLQKLTGPIVDRSGQPVDKLLLKDGSLTALPANFAGKASLEKFIPDTGHNIAAVFWNFLINTRGPVIENERLVTGDVVDWLFSVGLPITEPYWTKSKVGGIEREVLVQAFERRVLTYTPANPAAYQVEMGNVGQHYYSWRKAAEAASAVALPLDTATQDDLNRAGGLAFRQAGATAYYKFAARAGEAAQAGNLVGGVPGAGMLLPGPDLVFTAPESAGRQALYQNDLKGNNRLLGYAVTAALSPDRSKIAYINYTGPERADLFVQNLKGGGPQPIASEVVPALSWSSDSTKLAILLEGSNRVRIAVSESGSAPRDLFLTPADTLAESPVFSPDGKWLLYTLLRLSPDDRGPKVSASQIRAINLASGEEKLVASNAAQPVFSPDGTQLAYLGWNNDSLWRLTWSADGPATSPQKLAAARGCELECANTGRPNFSPDGKWLTFTGPARNLLVVRSGGGPTYTLTPPPGGAVSNIDIDPVWIKN